MYYSSAIFRRKAIAALKGHWQTALLIALIVNLPTLMMQAFSAFTGNDLMERIQMVVVSASRDGTLSDQLLVSEIQTLLESTGFWVIRGLEVLAWLVTPCLTLGMYRWMMDLLGGTVGPVNTVFCRMRQFFRAIGLQLMIILKVLLWMLPGIAVSVGVLIPFFRAASAQEQMSALQRAYSLSLPILLLTVIPGVIAMLQYALSEYILAEKPENKILFCVRRSRELMRDQKRNLFSLLISFLLWYLLSLLVGSLLSGVLSLVIQMLASLALSVYMAGSVAAFYLHLEHRETGEEGAEPAPEELN